MQRILIIEDDELTADIYRDRLLAEGYAIEVAHDGQAGLKSFEIRQPDLVILDLMLPQMNGVEVLKAIRSRSNPAEVHVLVFTNAFISGMVQQAWEAGANQVITKPTMTPRLMTRLIRDALDSHPREAAGSHADPDDDSGRAEARTRFLEAAPETMVEMWRLLRGLVAAPRYLTRVRELIAKVHSLNAQSTRAGLGRITQLLAALEALFRDLLVKPQHVTPSTLLTSAQAFDTLRLLFARDDVEATEHPLAARILVVDDDEITRRAVKHTLREAGLKPTCVSDADQALQQASKKSFDALLLDIEMPETDGLELCTRLRRLPQYQRRPIIFLTLHRSFEQRTESALHGGDDFISKPFLYSELIVKVLSHVLPAPHKPAAAGHSPSERGTDANLFSRRELNRLRHALLNSLDGWRVGGLHDRN